MSREKILKMLEQSKGTYVSGEEISRILGVSRSAVWKHIKALRKQGYQISGSSRKGYLFEGNPDFLYQHEIQKELNTAVLGREVFYYSSVDSTNQVAHDLARKGCPEGSLVVAEEQTAGKGRWSRTWFSPAGLGLWFSLVLRPALSPLSISQIPLVVGASCARAIHEHLGLKPGLKWPNDLVFDGKKACGILVEMDADAERVNFLVVGIGINVNQEKDDFPPDLRETATSLKMELGEEVERTPLLRRILEALESDYYEYCRNGFEQGRDWWLRYNVTLGRPVRVQVGSDILVGTAIDLDMDGSLVLRLNNRQVRRCNAGEITFCHI